MAPLVPTTDADAIMDELFAEVEQSLHIPRPQSGLEANTHHRDTVDLEDLDLELNPEEDVMWIAPYGAPPSTPPPTVGNQPTPEGSGKSDKGWITPVLLTCACGSALLASVLWSFHLAHRLSQIDRGQPASTTPVADTTQPQEPKYVAEIRELLRFAPVPSAPNPTVNPVAPVPTSDPTALPPPPLSSNPLPIPQTVYVPVYQPPTTALPPVETTPPPAPETASVPDKSYTLVGVLSFGDRSSAMFEFEGTVMSVNLGKPVGNTGWILSKVQQRDVVLKRNNETKSVVVGQKF